MFGFLESATGNALWKKVFFKISQNSQEITCDYGLFFNKVADLRLFFKKKETLAQVFSHELCENFKNTFLQDTFGWLLLQINDSEAVLVAVQAFSKE